MANISYKNLWESEFDNIVSSEDRLQDANIIQLKLKGSKKSMLIRTIKKIRTNFEPFDDSNVINKDYLDRKLPKKEGQISYIGKNHNQFKLPSDKQSVEEVLIEGTVNTTIQILHDKGLFEIYANVDKVLKKFCS